MSLSNDLISQFVKATKDTTKTPSETTVYGTVVYDGRPYVKLDGSDLLTPISTTTNVKDGERVTVMIKNHTATVTGNISSPSARTDDVDDVANSIGNQISEFEIVIADKVSTKEFDAQTGRIDNLVTDNVLIREELVAAKGTISELEADTVRINESLIAREADIKKLKAEKLDAKIADITYATITELDAVNAEIHSLESTYGEFKDLATDKLEAVEADIKELNTTKLSAEDAKLVYANIDFSNIGEAAIKHLFADYGLIKDIVIGDGTITGELVGVTIKGDLIEGNTIKADKLVVKGEDGLYYKLNVTAGATTSTEVSEEELQNGLHGTAIIAKTITAEKIAVNDLVAFDATIGGFNITESAIYSGVKEAADNTTRGVYLDRDGQLSVGDADNFLKYYKDADGNYKLEISAASIIFSTSKKTIEELVQEVNDIEVGARNLIRNSTTLKFKDYFFETSASSILGSAVLGQMIIGEE